MLRIFFTISRITENSCFWTPGKATMITSRAPFIFFISQATASRSLLFTLFLTVALGETFLLTTKPKRLSPRLLFNILTIKKAPLTLFPPLNTTSKSFFLVSRCIFGNIVDYLDRQFFPSFSPSSLHHLFASAGFFALQKTMGSGSFFLFWVISKTHAVCVFFLVNILYIINHAVGIKKYVFYSFLAHNYDTVSIV